MSKRSSPKRTWLACLVVIAVAAALLVLVFSTEPAAERTGATREDAMLVEVLRVERGTHRPEIVAMGTVEAAREVVLSPRVAGQVIERAEAFSPGEQVREGEVLLRVDPADFENAVQQRRGELARTEADLRIEQGRQEVARREYALLGDDVTVDDQALVLREPQLAAARARVEAAQAAVAQAELNLGRTRIRAPFDAQVLRRSADVGAQVAPGDDLGRLVGTELYWVEATVPLSALAWLSLPDRPAPDAAGNAPVEAPVRVRNRTAWPEGVEREARLLRQVGILEDRTRLARVLVGVTDPLANTTEGPPLILGSFVEVRIPGRSIEDVVRLDRDHLRPNDTVWVMADGALDIREVEVVFRDARHAYVASGLETGERVVTTDLATVTQGAALRLSGGEATADAARQERAGERAEERDDGTG